MSRRKQTTISTTNLFSSSKSLLHITRNAWKERPREAREKKSRKRVYSPDRNDEMLLLLLQPQKKKSNALPDHQTDKANTNEISEELKEEGEIIETEEFYSALSRVDERYIWQMKRAQRGRENWYDFEPWKQTILPMMIQSALDDGKITMNRNTSHFLETIKEMKQLEKLDIGRRTSSCSNTPRVRIISQNEYYTFCQEVKRDAVKYNCLVDPNSQMLDYTQKMVGVERIQKILDDYMRECCEYQSSGEQIRKKDKTPRYGNLHQEKLPDAFKILHGASGSGKTALCLETVKNATSGFHDNYNHIRFSDVGLETNIENILFTNPRQAVIIENANSWPMDSPQRRILWTLLSKKRLAIPGKPIFVTMTELQQPFLSKNEKRCLKMPGLRQEDFDTAVRSYIINSRKVVVGDICYALNLSTALEQWLVSLDAKQLEQITKIPSTTTTTTTTTSLPDLWKSWWETEILPRRSFFRAKNTSQTAKRTFEFLSDVIYQKKMVWFYKELYSLSNGMVGFALQYVKLLCDTRNSLVSISAILGSIRQKKNTGDHQLQQRQTGCGMSGYQWTLKILTWARSYKKSLPPLANCPIRTTLDVISLIYNSYPCWLEKVGRKNQIEDALVNLAVTFSNLDYEQAQRWILSAFSSSSSSTTTNRGGGGVSCALTSPTSPLDYTRVVMLDKLFMYIFCDSFHYPTSFAKQSGPRKTDEMWPKKSLRYSLQQWDGLEIYGNRIFQCISRQESENLQGMIYDLTDEFVHGGNPLAEFGITY